MWHRNHVYTYVCVGFRMTTEELRRLQQRSERLSWGRRADRDVESVGRGRVDKNPVREASGNSSSAEVDMQDHEVQDWPVNKWTHVRGSLLVGPMHQPGSQMAGWWRLWCQVWGRSVVPICSLEVLWRSWFVWKFCYACVSVYSA